MDMYVSFQKKKKMYSSLKSVGTFRSCEHKC